MHNLGRLIRQFICLDDSFKHRTSVLGFGGGDRESLTVPANHLDNKSAFCLFWLVLNVAFTALNRSILVPYVSQAAFEYRKESL